MRICSKFYTLSNGKNFKKWLAFDKVKAVYKRESSNELINLFCTLIVGTYCTLIKINEPVTGMNVVVVHL